MHSGSSLYSWLPLAEISELKIDICSHWTTSSYTRTNYLNIQFGQIVLRCR